MATQLVRDDISTVSYRWEDDPPPSVTSGASLGSGSGGVNTYGPLTIGWFDGDRITLPSDPSFRGWGTSVGTSSYKPPNKGYTPGGGGDSNNDVNPIDPFNLLGSTLMEGDGGSNEGQSSNSGNPTTNVDDNNSTTIPGYPGYKGDYDSGRYVQTIENDDGSRENYITDVNSNDNSDGSRTVTITTIYVKTNPDGNSLSTGRTQTAALSAEDLRRIRG